MAAQEAVELHRGLARALPQAFGRNFAISLGTIARILHALGRDGEIEALASEAQPFLFDLE
jgi:hypothetical protein